MEKDEMDKIRLMPAGIEKCRKLAQYGAMCLQSGRDYDAADALSQALAMINWENPGEDAPLLDSIYRNLCALSGSRDECAWEIASQAAGDYSFFLQSRNASRD